MLSALSSPDNRHKYLRIDALKSRRHFDRSSFLNLDARPCLKFNVCNECSPILIIMVLAFLIGIFYLFSDLFYWVKWIVAFTALHVWRRKHRKRFDLYNVQSYDQPEKLGVLVPEEEKILESPCPEEHLHEAFDDVFLYGINSESERLVLRITRAPNDEADAWIYLRLKDGRCYHLQETRGLQRNYGGKCTSFTCSGLQMYYLSPMRKWRILYCGMLNESKQTNESSEQRSVFVKFTFLWKASSDVFDHAYDIDIKAMASATAKTNWNSLTPPVDRIPEIMNFYSQSGVIYGTVSIGEDSDVEIYLFGERIRYLSKKVNSVGCRFQHILGVTPASGLVLHLGKTSVPNVFKNLCSGFIVHPDTFIRVIEDGCIISKKPENGELGKELTVMFKAGRQYEFQGSCKGNGAHLKTEHPRNGHFEVIEIEFQMEGLKGSGFMLSGEILKLPERKHQRVPPPLLSTLKPFTVYFTDHESHLTDLTGGKGSSLGVLTKLSNDLKSEFTVPKGIVVTTAAYEEFLSEDVINKIEMLKDVSYGNVPGNIQEACKIVTTAVERSSIPEKIAEDIEEKLFKIFNGNISDHRVAVRSSATGEDTDQMSAAGQMDTFLGVQGLKEIYTAVKKCWASQFAYIATEYKRQNGQVLNSPMAVVIQEMVECEAAGVLFTCDPVTNNPTVITITGNYGLGESVVSGSEEPDTIILTKEPMHDIKIKSVTIGLKEHRIIMKDSKSVEGENTVITEDIPEEKRLECCISEDTILKLGKLSLKIEKYFKSPRDIEWGINGDHIYILQSRPITSSAATTDYEIMHEFDGPLRCEGEFFTICNVGEVMPGATSPLAFEILQRIHYFVLEQKEMTRRQKNSFGRHKYFSSGLTPLLYHYSMSVIDLLTRVGDTETLISKSMMIGIFGRMLDDPQLKVLTQYKEVAKHQKMGLGVMSNLLWNMFFSGRPLEELKKIIFAWENPAERGRTSIETFDLITKNCSHIIQPYVSHVTCTEMSSLWNMYMFATLANAKGCIDTDVYSDFAKLLATTLEVESADIPSAIQKLALCIAKDPKKEDFISMELEEAEEWLRTSDGMAGSKYREFLMRHGHRCIKEFDVSTASWRMDAKPLINVLQNMAGSLKEVREKTAEDISSIIPQLKVPLNWKTKLLLKFLLPNCRRGIRERETGKSLSVKAMDNIRRGFHHLSKLMVAEGYIPDSKLFYFLTLDDIQELLQTRNPRLIARANHRRKLFPIVDKYLLPEIWKGLPIPINLNDQDEKFEYVADLTMKGIPVSQGTVKGYARVVISLQEAADLKPGEILITYGTDIGWSPYFPILGGVVTELGGLISHGAVVSREYGLPCVVGLHGATKNFVTGDYVLVDGNRGILQRLSPPNQ